jgi:hypothetical protein
MRQARIRRGRTVCQSARTGSHHQAMSVLRPSMANAVNHERSAYRSDHPAPRFMRWGSWPRCLRYRHNEGCRIDVNLLTAALSLAGVTVLSQQRAAEGRKSARMSPAGTSLRLTAHHRDGHAISLGCSTSSTILSGSAGAYSRGQCICRARESFEPVCPPFVTPTGHWVSVFRQKDVWHSPVNAMPPSSRSSSPASR